MATIAIERPREHVAVLRLDRPDVRNALNYELVSAIHDALDDLAGDDDCRVIVLTGTGESFCAGLDLRNFGSPPAVGTHRHARAGTSGQAFLANLVQHIHDTPQIVIAAVNGAAFGGGLALAAACDLRFCSQRATFCSAFIKTGLTGTDVGVTYLLPRLIGAARAFDLIVTGRTMDAVEAERAGLVSRVFGEAELLEESLAVAETVAGYTNFGVRRTKEVMWHNLDAPNLAMAIALENRNQELGSREPEVLSYMRDYASRFRK